ncbi:Cytochrome c oxidase subunit 6b-3 [Glycine max]|nr:Cytochrome c oxidase subunit 6b-3 [Glycine max]
MPCGYATIELKAAPADFHFPTTNHTRHCFTRYTEFHRCLATKGGNSGECERFAKYYRSLCPVCVAESRIVWIINLYTCTPLSVRGNGSSSFCKLLGLINKMERIFSQVDCFDLACFELHFVHFLVLFHALSF